jgi:hypothetical protein
MASTRFDTISRIFARRKAADRISQEATPTTGDSEKIPYLFVQSFGDGTITPKPGEDGAYTITLEHGLGQTLYFGDRPSRDVGTVPTGRFLQGLGFSDDNPPNAALVVDDGAGGTEIAVVELTSPTYDEASRTATYDVKVLEAWEESTELGLTDAPADLADLPASFGAAHLFIDDCSDDGIACVQMGYGVEYWYPNQGFCWNYGICVPCVPYGHVNPYDGAAWDWWNAKCRNGCDGTCYAGPCSIVGPCPDDKRSNQSP